MGSMASNFSCSDEMLSKSRLKQMNTMTSTGSHSVASKVVKIVMTCIQGRQNSDDLGCIIRIQNKLSWEKSSQTPIWVIGCGQILCSLNRACFQLQNEPKISFVAHKLTKIWYFVCIRYMLNPPQLQNRRSACWFLFPSAPFWTSSAQIGPQGGNLLPKYVMYRGIWV